MKPKRIIDARSLRAAAEARLEAKQAVKQPQTDADMLALQHELEVHQIELELQNEELLEKGEALQAALDRYTTLFDSAPVGYLNLTRDGTIRLTNLTCHRLLGLGHADLEGRRFGVFVEEADRRIFSAFLENLFATPAPRTCEVRLCPTGSTSLFAQLDGQCSCDGEECRVSLCDVTDRKQAERYNKILRQVLVALNEPGSLRDSISRVLDILKAGTGFDAVSLRLRTGEDYPYFAQRGFSESFLLTENSLVEELPGGGMCRGADGRVKLECTCGMVISGKADAANPLCTRGGSFWTNDDSALLHLPPDQDPRHRPRNRCIHDGYASLALIPLRANDEIVGLLQFNDRRTRRFSPAVIAILENIATHVGEMLMRKSAEELLAKARVRNELILNSTAEGIIGLDTQGIHIFANSAAERMLGWQAGELIGHDSHSLWHHHNPDGIPIPKEECNIQATYRTGKVHHSAAEWFWRKGGTSFPVEYYSTPICEGGRVVGAVLTFVDITESKRAEAAIHASQQLIEGIINALPVRVFWKDKNLVYLGCNAVFAHDAGLADPQDIVGKDDYQMGWREQAEIYRADDRQVIESGCARLLIEEPQTTPSGNTITLLTSKIPLRNVQGEIDGVIGVYMDITERKRAEEDVRILNADLERRVHERTAELQAVLKDVQEAKTLLLRNDKLTALGRMSAGLIHEINNPLNYATQGLSVLEMISADLPEPVRGEFLETLDDVKDGVARVARIVADLRGFTHGADGHSQTFELRPVVDRALRFFAHEFKRDVGIEVDVPAAITVCGNPNHVVQILVNLVQNSLDAMRTKQYEKGVSPAISVTSNSAGQGVLLRVRDNGPGIPSAIIGNIFDPFFTTRDIGLGMGLGLTICHRIMAEHGGGIDVCSEHGVFCEFALTLPQPDTAATAAPVGEGPPGKDSGANTG